MNVLVLVVSVASQTPRVVGQGKQVLQSGWVSYGPVQTFHPLLALLEGCEVASVGNPARRLERLVSLHWDLGENDGKVIIFQMFHNFQTVNRGNIVAG